MGQWSLYARPEFHGCNIAQKCNFILWLLLLQSSVVIFAEDLKKPTGNITITGVIFSHANMIWTMGQYWPSTTVHICTLHYVYIICIFTCTCFFKLLFSYSATQPQVWNKTQSVQSYYVLHVHQNAETYRQRDCNITDNIWPNNLYFGVTNDKHTSELAGLSLWSLQCNDVALQDTTHSMTFNFSLKSN